MRNLLDRALARLRGGLTNGPRRAHRANGRAGAASRALPVDFEASVYIALNPDLRISLADPSQAAAHYLRSGSSEGRPYRAGDGRHGALPADFDADAYVDLHPDLEHLRGNPCEATVHFLVEGKSEGRSYKFDVERYGQIPADFDADAYIDLNPDLEELRGNASGATVHYLTEGRPEGRSYKFVKAPVRRPARGKRGQAAKTWPRLFNPADFRALRPDLAGTAETREQLTAAFVARGIDDLVPLAFGKTFDPVFYQARYADAAGLTPAEAYRHWLFDGVPAGRPRSEAEAVEKILGLAEFPDAFDWERYLEQHPLGAEPGWTRLQALEHFLKTSLEQTVDAPLREGSQARFLEAWSDVLSARQPKRALGALAEALAIEPANGRLHHKMADRRLEMGDLAGAERYDRRALELGQSSVWVFATLIDLAARRGDIEDAYGLLAGSQARCSGFRPWREALHQTIERDFGAASERLWALYRDGKRREADTAMEASLTRIVGVFRTLDDLPGFVGANPEGHVVMFANHGLPQCRHYRVEQRSRQLVHLGVPYRVFNSEGAERAREALVNARALIIYREPAFPATIRLVLHARAMGVPVFYDIDDLIFDPDHYPDGFEVYEKQIPYDQYVGLLYGTPLLRFAIGLCDAGIASTTALARHVAPLTSSQSCHVVPNGLDDRNERFLRSPPALRSPDDDIFVFYGSGTKAHNRNFNETVGPALVEVLATRPRVKLVVIGYLDLDPAFDPYADRILRFGFTKNLEAYWALLSEVDINLAVLVAGEMNDCKSEIKWLEAAVSGVPSIVSASARYREVLNDGVDAMLAQSPEDWRDALFRLVDDAPLRHRIGARARERASADYALGVTAARLDAALRTPFAKPTFITPPDGPDRRGEPRLPGAGQRATSRPREHGPTRVLVVHVLFPPQTSGGATRVVRDNVDDLLDRYGGEFEVAVFTTDFDASHPSARVGRYRNIPVYRCSRRSSAEFDYRDSSTAQRFLAALHSWKPDLVHFHCLQFLTGSIVEVCRREAVPYLVTVHDAWWISPHQFLIDDDALLRHPAPRALSEAVTGSDRLREIDRKRFLADQLMGAAVVTAVSESFARVCRDAGFPNTCAVPNGLSPVFSGGRARVPRQGRVRVGHIGGRSRHKGVHLLEMALGAQPFSNLEALVIDHSQEPEYERRYTWGNTPVTIRGAVSQDDMIALYADIDVLVAPSIWPESYGLVSREALAEGLWVVASNLGAIGEDIVEGENGFLIDVRDARDLTRVLHAIDADPGRFRASPSRPYHPRMATQQTDELVALYRDVAGRPRDAAAPGT